MRAKSETLTEMCIFIHVRYPICIYQEDTSIVYINLRKLSLYPPTRYSIASYYNDEYRNHLTNHSSLVCLKHVFGYHSWPVASPIKRRSLWTIDQAAMTANTSAGALA